MSAVTMERVVDKIRELEARIRALERMAEDDRTLDDIRTSITMLAESMANGADTPAPRPAPVPAKSSHRTPKPANASPAITALSDPRFRVI